MTDERRRFKVAFLTVDAREAFREYDKPQPYFGTAPEALLQGFALLSDVAVHVVCCTQKPMASPSRLAPNIWYHSLPVSKIGWMRSAYQGCIRATRKKLRELQPQIVHGQGTERDCAISAVFSRYPNVLTIHGNMRLIARVNGARPLSYEWLAARLERLTIPRSRGVVCITRYTQQAVSGLAKRMWLVPNAVDSAFFSIDAQPRSDRPPRILCVGHVCPRKNQNAFIRALDPLAQERKFDVIFLGQTAAGRPYDDEFLDLVRARPWCRYDGFADREKLKEHFREATLLVLPSLEDNCPMVILEAMAAGVPVVGANVGGVPELIEYGRTGLLCDPWNHANMAETVKRLLTDRSLSVRLGNEGKAEAMRRFHPQVIARQHVEIYREVLSSQPWTGWKDDE